MASSVSPRPSASTAKPVRDRDHVHRARRPATGRACRCWTRATAVPPKTAGPVRSRTPRTHASTDSVRSRYARRASATATLRAPTAARRICARTRGTAIPAETTARASGAPPACAAAPRTTAAGSTASAPSRRASAGRPHALPARHATASTRAGSEGAHPLSRAPSTVSRPMSTSLRPTRPSRARRPRASRPLRLHARRGRRRDRRAPRAPSTVAASSPGNRTSSR